MPNRSTYRQALLAKLGGGGVYTTTNTGTTTTLVCSSAFADSSLPNTHLSYAWVNIPTPALGQRRVTKTGLNSATGEITVGGVFGDVVAVNTVFEISRYLPLAALTRQTGISLNECLDLGLQDLESPDEIALSTVAGAYSISLATYAEWLNRASRIVAVLDPPMATGYPPQSADWRNPRPVFDGTSSRLDFDTPYQNTGDTVTLRVLRPADTLISGVEQPSGSTMTSESATALPEVNELVTVSMVHAYRARAAQADSDEQRKTYLGMADEWVVEAKKLEHYHPRGMQMAAPQSTAAEAA